MKAALKAISYYLPPRVLGNQELARLFPEWPAEKIVHKLGIEERHIVDEGTCSSDLGVESARRLLAEHTIDPATIDFVLFCTQSPDYFLPTTACLIQDRLGIPVNAGALDFNLGCSGYVYGLGLAQGLIESGSARNVLLIVAETYSRYIHPQDKSVRTLFGDGAAATLIGSTDGAASLGPFVYGSDGKGADNLIVKNGAARHPSTGRSAPDSLDAAGNFRNDDYLYMNGPEIYNFTLRTIPKLVDDTLSRSALRLEDVNLFVFHQANKFMLDTIEKKLRIPSDKLYRYMLPVGNTVSATIPIALYHALKEGRISRPSTVMLVGFGVGYSWAAGIIHFK